MTALQIVIFTTGLFTGASVGAVVMACFAMGGRADDQSPPATPLGEVTRLPDGWHGWEDRP